MDTSSRRAFALDSRTVWVEQQIVGPSTTVVAKDNYVLGPGEYNPSVLERHVSTPSLGGSKGNAAFFQAFKGDIRIRTPLGKGSPTRSFTPSPTRKSVGSPSKRTQSQQTLRDFTTVYHDRDTRNPLDPKNAFTPTPGAKLAHSQVELRSTVPFGGYNVMPIPFGERFPTKEALPDYHPNYDSEQLRPRAVTGKFDKARRIYIPSKNDNKKASSAVTNNTNEADPESSQALVAYGSPKKGVVDGDSSFSPQKLSVFQQRCNLVPLPKLKYRIPPKLTFDASSYRHNQFTGQPLDLTPKLINQKASVHIYDGILAIPRQHKAPGVAPKLQLRKPGMGGGVGGGTSTGTSSSGSGGNT
mmetsp:Transcript_30442/g.51448  ORF Transcript_30442/g.51448 Transcript_30442/m.51448 type:complete len:356 (+) Transcript_30442:94-1161(+)